MCTIKRMKDRRLQLGLSAETMAEKIDVARSTYFRYENGDIEKLPVSLLPKIASALSTTPEYLAGWEDKDKNYMALGNKDVMGNNIKFYMDKKGVDRNKLSQDLKVSYSTISDWINGNTYPRIDKIELMANYFGIEKSDLVEDNEALGKPSYNAMRIATHIDDDVTDDQMEDIINYIEFIKSKK